MELAPVRDPDGVVDAFAALFGVTASAGEPLEAALVEFLRSKHLLLVVDNCEHVLEAVVDLVESIERSCVGRGGAGDQPRRAGAGWRADPGGPVARRAGRETPIWRPSRSPTRCRLFVERARATDAEFALDADNADAVVQVCRRLDGVPLAIELAAARVTMMSLPELAGALDRRFEVLAGGRRRGIERHQTLRATIDWSYDLLTAPQRRLVGPARGLRRWLHPRVGRSRVCGRPGRGIRGVRAARRPRRPVAGGRGTRRRRRRATGCWRRSASTARNASPSSARRCPA